MNASHPRIATLTEEEKYQLFLLRRKSSYLMLLAACIFGGFIISTMAAVYYKNSSPLVTIYFTLNAGMAILAFGVTIIHATNVDFEANGIEEKERYGK